MRWRLVVRNVCDAVDAPRVPKKEMQALTGKQAQQFPEAAVGDPLESLYVLALTTGMRQGELLVNPPGKRVHKVGLRGLEPPTHGLGNRRSIH